MKREVYFKATIERIEDLKEIATRTGNAYIGDNVLECDPSSRLVTMEQLMVNNISKIAPTPDFTGVVIVPVKVTDITYVSEVVIENGKVFNVANLYDIVDAEPNTIYVDLANTSYCRYTVGDYLVTMLGKYSFLTKEEVDKLFHSGQIEIAE